MPIRLLIINNHDSFTYNLVDLIRRLNVEFAVCNVEDLDFSEVKHFTHLLISPGPDVPQAYPQLFQLLSQFHQHKPILGVCLGHQTLCQFLGAELYNLQRVRHGQNRQIQILDQNPLFKNLPNQFQVGLYHSWAVRNLPPCLQLSAQCEEGVVMAVQHQTLPLYGVQFHPESFISEYGQQIIQNWLNATV